MTKTKRPIVAVIIACLCLAAVIILVLLVPPSSWLLEILVVLLTGAGLGLLGSWLWGRKKYGVMSGVFIVVTLLLNRLGVLNWITFGLWLAVAGLITLTN